MIMTVIAVLVLTVIVAVTHAPLLYSLGTLTSTTSFFVVYRNRTGTSRSSPIHVFGTCTLRPEICILCFYLPVINFRISHIQNMSKLYGTSLHVQGHSVCKLMLIYKFPSSSNAVPLYKDETGISLRLALVNYINSENTFNLQQLHYLWCT